MNNYKTQLRNSLFEKYFEVEDGILLSDLVKVTNTIVESWQSLHKLLEKNVEDYDSWSRLEDIKEIEYNEKKYLIIKVMIWRYIIIDLETKKTFTENDIASVFEEQFFVDNFDEVETEKQDYYNRYWCMECNNADEIINYYNQNKKIFNCTSDIFYKINIGDVYTSLYIRLNGGIQLSFQGPNQILYETLFINSDLTPSGMQDAQNKIGIKKMREMFDRLPNIRIPKEYVPKEFYEDGLIKEDNKVKSIKK